MSNIYKEMGFMCGLEIHQRLSTSKKLFCSCSTNILEKTSKPVAMINRYQRAVAGELGSVDKSAEFEVIRNRSFTYNIFEKNTCLVDVDEEPPHELNLDALSIALSLASAMNMTVIHEMEPMRKGVVDGSDPSAFQRTILVGLEGMIKVNQHEIKIPSMFLEEESSGIVSTSGSTVIYNTDRLAVPLIEIDTDPYIPDPKTAKDVALYIGTLLRLTGKVQRGIGSIRQDVNMSIKDGARVEIKGVQELNFIDKFLENEIKRQQTLIEIKEKLLKNGAAVWKPTNVTPIFAGTNVDVMKYHIKDGAVFAFALKGFKGILGTEINPNRRLGTEISDYAKMAGVHGIIHSDENLDKYGFTKNELVELRKHLSITENDSFILIAGKPEEVKKGVDLAVWRCEYAMKGVPKETRAAHDNEFYTSKFMRPLPTGSRMYPETDVRPVRVTVEMLEEADKNAPNVEKEREWIASKIKNQPLAEQLMLSSRLQLFKSIIHKTKADPEFVANILVQRLTEFRREKIDIDSLNDETMIEIFRSYAEEKITKQGLEELIKLVAKSGGEVGRTIQSAHLSRIKSLELASLVESMKRENKGIETNELRNKIMTKYRLVVDGAELNKLL